MLSKKTKQLDTEIEELKRQLRNKNKQRLQSCGNNDRQRYSTARRDERKLRYEKLCKNRTGKRLPPEEAHRTAMDWIESFFGPRWCVSRATLRIAHKRSFPALDEPMDCFHRWEKIKTIKLLNYYGSNSAEYLIYKALVEPLKNLAPRRNRMVFEQIKVGRVGNQLPLFPCVKILHSANNFIELSFSLLARKENGWLNGNEFDIYIDKEKHRFGFRPAELRTDFTRSIAPKSGRMSITTIVRAMEIDLTNRDIFRLEKENDIIYFDWTKPLEMKT